MPHNTTTHTDDECHKQKELRGLAANLALLQSSNNIGSAHLAQQQGSEPSTFGFSLSAIGESLAEASSNTSKDETHSTAKQNHHLPGGFFGAFELFIIINVSSYNSSLGVLRRLRFSSNEILHLPPSSRTRFYIFNVIVHDQHLQELT